MLLLCLICFGFIHLMLMIYGFLFPVHLSRFALVLVALISVHFVRPFPSQRMV